MASSPPFSSPGYWDYHPRAAGGVLSSTRVDSGQLAVTDRGERWWIDDDAPHARVAPMLAPEPLVGIVELNEGWVYVGRSGATFESREPLADFARSTSPPEPLAKVSVAGATLLGITRRGDVLRSDDLGFTWTSLDVSGRSVDVALLDSGRGLLLQAPERLLSTSDGGRSWLPLASERFGAVSLDARGDRVEVAGVLDRRSWDPTTATAWHAPRPRRAASTPVSFEVPLRPSARAIAAGHALFAGGTYFELVASGRSWSLRKGQPGAPLTTRAMDARPACSQARLFGAKDVLYMACGDPGDGTVESRVYRSADAGASWSREPYRLRADFSLLRAAVTADGSWVVSGVCPPSEARAGCPAIGVHRRAGNKKGAAIELERVSVPGLSGLPLSLGSASAGEVLLILGRRTKGDSLVVFAAEAVSLEFRVEEISELEVGDERRFDGSHQVQVSAPTEGPDGHVAVVVNDASSAAPALLVLDAFGRLLSVGQGPMPDASIAAAGAFAVAVHPRSGQVWESLDGGIVWQAIGAAPAPMCSGRTDAACASEVHCWRGGCVFDDSFSRVGWRGQAEAGRQPLLADSKRHAPAEQRRVPIACQLGSDSGWTTLRGARAPEASQAQLGDVAWFAFDVDFRSASVAMHEALNRPQPRIETVALFEPAAEPSRWALYASLQIEGIAALVQSGSQATVAWRNLFESRTTRVARLPSGVRFPQRPTRFPTALAQPALLSISRGGLFVRAEAPDEPAPTYFVDQRGVAPLPVLAWEPGQVSGRPELIRAEGQPLAVTIVGSGAAIVRQRYEQGRWQRDAVTLGLLQPDSFDLRQAFDLAYRGDRPGLHLMFLDGQPSSAWWFAFEAGPEPFAPALEVPTQAHLSERPDVCSKAQRHSSPRLVTPPERGTRHPLVVTHTTEPLPGLLTDDAVLFGDPEQPCVAAFSARPPGKESPGDEVSALVVPDREAVSWLFRRAAAAEEFDVRPMRCDYDAGLDVPVELRSTSP